MDEIAYKTFFELSQDLVCIAGTDGYFKKINANWSTKLGYSIEYLLSKPFLDFIHPDDLQSTLDEVKKLEQGAITISFKNRYKKSNGEYIWLDWNGTPEPSTGTIFSIARDITETKKSKENLEHLVKELTKKNRQLEDFAYIVSHNLRSPVSNISMLVYLLSQAKNKAERIECMERIIHTSENLQETFEELINLIQVSSSNKVSSQKLQFKNVLDTTIKTLNGQISQNNVKVISNFDKASSVNYPKVYMESIFLNLISNAIKYKSPNREPEISIKTEKKQKAVRLTFQDNGVGIDMKRYAEKLFGLRETFHEHPEAKGLGLFITKSQINAMGGEIWAESEENRGTRFIIEF